MVGEVGDERGALPMLAFAAARLWTHRDREAGLLTREAYEHIGGVTGALAQHAEKTLEQIGTDRVPIVRELFRNLVTADGTRAARDREELLSVFLGHDPESAAEVLDALIDARLLTSYEILHEEEAQTARHRVEIVHESLLSNWPRLVRWRTQDTEGVQLRDELRQAAQIWEQHSRTEDLLWTGTAFREFQLWRERYPGGLTTAEEQFAAAMSSHAERRKRRRRLTVTAAFVALLTVLAVVGGFWRQAMREALRAEASKLLALAQVQVETDPTEALALATSSLELADTAEARSFVMRVLWEAPPAFVLEAPPIITSVMRFPSFSPAGGRLAFSGNSEVVVVLADEGGEPVELRGLDAAALSCANYTRWASEDLLVTGLCPHGFAAESIRIWSVAEGRLTRTIEFGGPASWNAADGRLLAAIAEFDSSQEVETLRMRSWQLPDGQPEDLGRIDWKTLGAVDHYLDPSGNAWLYAKGRRILARPLPIVAGGHDRLIGSHSVDIVGMLQQRGPQRLVSLDETGENRIWSVSGGEAKLLRVFPKPEGGVLLDLDPTGRFLYPSFDERLGKGLLWNLEALSESPPLELRRAGSWAYAAHSFDPAGEWLVATTRAHSEATFWPLRRPYPSILQGATTGRKAMSFSPDGDYLAAVWPGGVRLLPMPGGGGHEVMKSTEAANITRLIFGPSGSHLLRCGLGGDLSIEPVDDGAPIPLEGFLEDTLIEYGAFSPSGRLVAAASGWSLEERTLRIWDLETDTTQAFDLPAADQKAVAGFEDQVGSLWFTDEETLFTVGGAGFLRWDLKSGSAEEVVAMPQVSLRDARASGDGRTVVMVDTDDGKGGTCDTPYLYDLPAGTRSELPSFGDCVLAIALDRQGTVLATGDAEGVVRVGRLDAGRPHLLVGHEGAAVYVAVSPDLRWVASTGSDGTLRLWPMPDLSAAPLHTLSHDEILTRLHSLTNLRAVRDPESSTGWKIEIGPFPGWEEVPAW